MQKPMTRNSQEPNDSHDLLGETGNRRTSVFDRLGTQDTHHQSHRRVLPDRPFNRLRRNSGPVVNHERHRKQDLSDPSQDENEGEADFENSAERDQSKSTVGEAGLGGRLSLEERMRVGNEKRFSLDGGERRRPAQDAIGSNIHPARRRVSQDMLSQDRNNEHRPSSQEKQRRSSGPSQPQLQDHNSGRQQLQEHMRNTYQEQSRTSYQPSSQSRRGLSSETAQPDTHSRNRRSISLQEPLERETHHKPRFSADSESPRRAAYDRYRPPSPQRTQPDPRRSETQRYDSYRPLQPSLPPSQPLEKDRRIEGHSTQSDRVTTTTATSSSTGHDREPGEFVPRKREREREEGWRGGGELTRPPPEDHRSEPPHSLPPPSFGLSRTRRRSSSDLPYPWEKCVSSAGDTYYYNIQTQKSTWSRPGSIASPIKSITHVSSSVQVRLAEQENARKRFRHENEERALEDIDRSNVAEWNDTPREKDRFAIVTDVKNEGFMREGYLNGEERNSERTNVIFGKQFSMGKIQQTSQSSQPITHRNAGLASLPRFIQTGKKIDVAPKMNPAKSDMHMVSPDSKNLYGSDGSDGNPTDSNDASIPEQGLASEGSGCHRDEDSEEPDIIRLVHESDFRPNSIAERVVKKVESRLPSEGLRIRNQVRDVLPFISRTVGGDVYERLHEIAGDIGDVREQRGKEISSRGEFEKRRELVRNRKLLRTKHHNSYLSPPFTTLLASSNHYQLPPISPALQKIALAFYTRGIAETPTPGNENTMLKGPGGGQVLYPSKVGSVVVEMTTSA